MRRRLVVGAAVAVALVLAVVVLARPDGPGGPPPRIRVVDAFTMEGTVALAVYLDLANSGGPDEVVGVEVVSGLPGDDPEVTLHQTARRDGLSIMEPTDAIAVDGDTATALTAAGAHLMLEGISGDVTTGDTITLRVDLRRSDDLVVEVRVVTADEAVELLIGETP